MSTSETLLKIERLNLVFHASVHRSWTLREAFVRAASDPLRALLSEKDRLHVAKDIDLEVRKGERVGIIGVNGSGKTSLCRCIAGMYPPTSGKVSVRGQVRAVFDTSVGINPELTGRENAELLSYFMFGDDPKRQALVEEALQFSELGRFLDVPYKLYSNGMQARLCLSLISAKPCDILILDEVFDGADAFFKEKISERVLKMIEGSGAVFFVSHSAEQLKTVCNRLIVLHQGQVAYDGDVGEGLRLYEQLGKGGQATQ